MGGLIENKDKKSPSYLPVEFELMKIAKTGVIKETHLEIFHGSLEDKFYNQPRVTRKINLKIYSHNI